MPSTYASNETTSTDRVISRGEATPHDSPIYSKLAPAYNTLWPALAGRSLADAVRRLDIQAGDRVLEVGVGTGISLRHYPTDCRFTGIDLSDSMLAEAADRVRDRQWTHVSLMQMNAEELTFADDCFDVVSSFHTISVVSDPRRMMEEVIRVCRPGGKILIRNHFRSPNPLIAKVVDRAGGVTKRLGWRTDLDSDDILDGLPLRLDKTYKSNPLSLFTVITATCTK